MSKPRYLWRQLTPEQQADLLSWRQKNARPWHSPPHRPSLHTHFHITAACYEHEAHIGHTRERMEFFCQTLADLFEPHSQRAIAWCVLPNHYHVLVETNDLPQFMKHLGKIHGRTSYAWNAEETTRGRTVWFRAADRAMRTERHFWATINYIHHNPIHHGYVKHWLDWPFSSASDYLQTVGREEALRIWSTYPVLDYGKGWDDPRL